MPRNVIYARKSTESEDRQVLSIPAQVAELLGLASRVGIAVDQVLQESRSAREPGRAVFEALLRDVAAGRIGSVLCWRLDRLARNPVDGGLIIHHLGHHRIERIVTPEGTHTGNGNDKLMLAVHFGMATKFIDDLSANVKRGQRAVLATGRTPGKAPLGYQKQRDPLAIPGRGAGTTVPDPERFGVVQKLWRLALTGSYTLHELHRIATDEMGLRTPKNRRSGGGPLSYSAFCVLFTKPFYAGQIVFGGDVYKGAHEPMVTWEEFQQVQRIFERCDAPRPWYRDFVYSGMLRCGACGRALVGEAHTNRYGYRYTYYRCTRKKLTYAVCAEPYVNERIIEAEVDRVLARLALPEPILRWTLRYLDSWATSEQRTAAATAATLERAIAAHRQTLDRLRGLVVRGVIAEDEYVRDRAATEGELRDLEAQQREPTLQIARWHEATKRVYEIAAIAREAFRSGDIRSRRELLGQLASNLVVQGRTVALQLHKPFDVLAADPPIGGVTIPHGSNLDGGDTTSLNENEKRPSGEDHPSEILRQCTREDSNL